MNHRVQSLLQLHLHLVHLLLLLLSLLLGLGGDLDDGLLGLLLQLLGSGHSGLDGDLMVLWGNVHDLLNQFHLLLGDIEHFLGLLLLLLNIHLLLLTLLALDLLLQLLDQSLDLHGSLLLDEMSLLTLLLLLTLLGNGDQLLQLQLHLLHLLLLFGGLVELSLTGWHTGNLVFGLLGHDLGLDLHDGGLHLSDWHLTGDSGNQSWGLLFLSLLLLLLLLSDHGVQLLLQFLLHGEHLLLHLDMLDLSLLLLALELLLLLNQEGDLLLLLGNLGLELGGVQGAQVLLGEELLLLALLLLGLLGILGHELLDQSEQLFLQSQLLLLHLLLAHDGLSDLLLLLLLGLGGNRGGVQRVLFGQLLLSLHDLDQLLLLLLDQLLLLLLLSDLLDGKVLHVQVSGDLHLLLLGLDDLLGDLLQLSDGKLLLLLALLHQGGGDRGLSGQSGLDQLDGSLLLNGLVHLLTLLTEEVGGLFLLTLLLLGHLEGNLGLHLLELSLQLSDLLLQLLLSLLLLLALLLLVLLLLTSHGLRLLLIGGQLLGAETLLQLGNELLDSQLVAGHWLLLLRLLLLLFGNAGGGLDSGHDVLGHLNGGVSGGGLLVLSLLLLTGLGDHEALRHTLDLRVVLNIDKLVHWRLSLVFA